MVVVFKKCSRSIKQQFKEETKQKIEKKWSIRYAIYIDEIIKVI